MLYTCCGGLDVHAKTVGACLITQGQKEMRTFSTMTADLLQLLDWLVTEGCTHVALESTGVYWRPVFPIREDAMEVLLGNARHVQAPPGRQPDVRDGAWRADLLRHGLLQASVLPPLHIRELHERTRYRQSLVKDRAAIANRVQKVLARGHSKRGPGASDPLGESGRARLWA